jgi:hypothetical protein
VFPNELHSEWNCNAKDGIMVKRCGPQGDECFVLSNVPFYQNPEHPSQFISDAPSVIMHSYGPLFSQDVGLSVQYSVDIQQP